MLVLKQPLSSMSKKDWEGGFDESFKNIEGIRHRTFCWTLDEREAVDRVVEFKQAGYDYRRQGIARCMLYQMALWTSQYADHQVIVADAHYHASGLYQSLGFRIAEREASLCWWPRSE